MECKFQGGSKRKVWPNRGPNSPEKPESHDVAGLLASDQPSFAVEAMILI